MGTLQLLMICTAINLLLFAVISNRIDIKGQKAAESERFHSIHRVSCKFEFSAILSMRCEVSPIDIVELLFKLNFDGNCGRTGRAWDSDMLSSLVNDAKSWLQWITFFVKRDYLHDIRVAHPDSRGMGQ